MATHDEAALLHNLLSEMRAAAARSEGPPGRGAQQPRNVEERARRARVLQRLVEAFGERPVCAEAACGCGDADGTIRSD